MYVGRVCNPGGGNSGFRLYAHHRTSPDASRAQTEDGRKNSRKVQFSDELSRVPSRSELARRGRCVKELSLWIYASTKLSCILTNGTDVTRMRISIEKTRYDIIITIVMYVHVCDRTDHGELGAKICSPRLSPDPTDKALPGSAHIPSVATGVRPHTKRSKIVDRVPVHVGTWYAFTAM
eukprot:COSAG02_NODE_114_length_35585_cov_149.458293_16_plen_179_part_00